MNTFFPNSEFACNTVANRDVLSAFKQSHEKDLTIQQGMSISEISDIVSEKIISAVKEQFETTKEQFHSKTK